MGEPVVTSQPHQLDSNTKKNKPKDITYGKSLDIWTNWAKPGKPGG